MMKIVILYGPPAVGKLSIAKRLSEATGLPVFHNHDVADLSSSIFPYGSKEYSELSSDLRMAFLEEIAKRKKIKGLILTYAYGVETYLGKKDTEFLKNLSTHLSSKGVEVYFVKLEAPHAVLLERVAHASRKKHKKLRDPEVLFNILSKMPVSRPLPFADSLVLNTSELKIPASVEAIRKYIGV